MGTQGEDPSLEDIEFLARSAHRVEALRRLREGSVDRDDLRDATGASKATVARLLNEFEDRNWVAREGRRYELTDFGRFVAEEFLQLVDRMETERALQEVWGWFPTDLPGFTVDRFADAVVSTPDPDLPYRSIPRFAELVGSARRLRVFSALTPKPSTYEHLVRRGADGKETEVVFPRAAIEDMLRVVPAETARVAVEDGQFTLLEGTSFPMDAGLTLSDDRLGLWGRDEEGISRAGIDTDAPEAVAWGESLYEEVRANARPVDLLEMMEGA